MDKPSNSCNDTSRPNDFQEKGRAAFRYGKLDVTGSWNTPSDRVIAEATRILREKIDRMPRGEHPPAAEHQLVEKESLHMNDKKTPRKYTPDYDRIADTILWLLDQPLETIPSATSFPRGVVPDETAG